MENFTYYNRTKIIYGRGTEKEVGAEARKLADKVLLHFGGGSIKRSGLYDTVVASLREHGVEIVELGGVVPNPRLDLVREGIELCRRENITLILAVGGGSVVDSAKAIAMGVHEENGDVWENFISRKPIQKAVDVATILTLPATGSEASPNTVITDDATQLKLGYGSELLRPVFSILNPELFFTLPRNQIANGVCDMMCHIFERYFTLTPKVELTDALCEATLRTIIENAYKLADNPQDYDAWAEIGFAGTLAHNNLLYCYTLLTSNCRSHDIADCAVHLRPLTQKSRLRRLASLVVGSHQRLGKWLCQIHILGILTLGRSIRADNLGDRLGKA